MVSEMKGLLFLYYSTQPRRIVLKLSHVTWLSSET